MEPTANEGAGRGCCCGGGRACASPPASADVGKTDARFTWRDRLGVIRVRLGIRRNQYLVAPGLYRLGEPGRDAPVMVSANYKLSFDVLRRALAGRDAWILVLDTRGVNVWCAAGKGTFGTEELVKKISETALEKHVRRRVLILPQLGASGVAAHEVEERTGFKVVWGPVRARDLGAFLDAGMRADEAMRRVRFNLADRAQLVLVEFAGALKYLVIAAVVLVVLGLLRFGPSWAGLAAGAVDLAGVVSALAAGTVFTPLLLPILPGRSFSLKGMVLGTLVGMVYSALSGRSELETAAWVLFSAAVSSFLALGFTGASTYTSLSGTVKEMRRYLPLQLAAAAAGALFFIVPAVARTFI